MILVTGPTGSGKTVSLSPSHIRIARHEHSTAEDPAEINLPGVNQVNVNNKVGLTFAAAMRALRARTPMSFMVGRFRASRPPRSPSRRPRRPPGVSTLHTQ